MDFRTLRSDLVRDLPPVAFPEPPAPVRFDLDQGMVDEETLPFDALKAAMVSVLEEDKGEALQYVSYADRAKSSSQRTYRSRFQEIFLGNEALRRQLARWIAARQGVNDLGPENFLVTSGTSAVFPLIAHAFVNPGEAVLMEAMTLGHGEKAFRMRGAVIRKVAIDSNGLMIEALERELEALRREGIRPKLLYTISTFHLPTGAVLPEERRHALLALARKWELVVIEDGVYAELRYDGPRVPSLWSLDRSGLVMQVHGFAKILAPGIRIGWIGGRPEMIDALAAARSDFGVSQWMCRAMARIMEDGILESHVERVAAQCRRKRDVAVAAVKKYCGDWVDFTPPQGGMYLWLEMRENVDWERALQAARAAGLSLRPGERFRPDGARYLRLAFCHASFEELEEGIRTLGSAIANAARVPIGGEVS